MNIHVHIDRLILDGLPIERSQGSLVRAAVEQELTRLLATHQLKEALRVDGAAARTRGGDVRVPSESQPAALGREVARSVYGSIGGTA